MNSLNDLGDEFNRHSGNKAMMIHTVRRAIQELMELLEVISSTDSVYGDDELWEPEQAADEIADVILTLAAGARTDELEIDLDEAVARKHLRNMTATWICGPNGTVKRVKENT